MPARFWRAFLLLLLAAAAVFIVLGMIALVVDVVLAQERYPGQQPGVPLPGEWDKLNWTWQQRCWYYVDRLMNHLIPVVGLAVAGAGGAVLHRRRSSSSGVRTP